MHDVKLFIELPAEIEKYLAQHRTDLVQLLRQQGVSVQQRYEPNPFKAEYEEQGAPRGMERVILVRRLGAVAVITALGIAADN